MNGRADEIRYGKTSIKKKQLDKLLNLLPFHIVK
jgi:hypothetical protein